ncbi:hypothetical protein ABT261_49810, partial [Amycolatopsis sp. NPDC000740]
LPQQGAHRQGHGKAPAVSRVGEAVQRGGDVRDTSRQLGGALAVAVFGALLSAGMGSGTRLSLLLAAGVAVLAALAAYKGLSGKDKE